MRQQGLSSLRTVLKNLSSKQFQLRMQLGSGQLNTNHLLKVVRKDIARAKTILTELENGQGE